MQKSVFQNLCAATFSTLPISVRPLLYPALRFLSDAIFPVAQFSGFSDILPSISCARHLVPGIGCLCLPLQAVLKSPGSLFHGALGFPAFARAAGAGVPNPAITCFTK
ncbi:hypothetical protein, partial [Sphingobacterium sp. UBA865]|uniref:hypothetical protein n=1 Tax=Sphingobacterium sp. UBA865 TaxID=1947527 RepID=UPI00257BEC10